jgi:YhcH/YjgK/YiaL family protein
LIIDNLKNASIYYGAGERIEAALRFLQRTDFSNVRSKTDYALDGRALYAWCSVFAQKPLAEGRWETHRRYGDIHFIIEGRQSFGYAFVGRLSPREGYDESKDVAFWRGNGSMLALTPGDFIIVFPGDGHMPDIAPSDGAAVKKAVVKFLV